MTYDEKLRTLEALVELCQVIMDAKSQNIISINEANEHLNLYLTEVRKMINGREVGNEVLPDSPKAGGST